MVRHELLSELLVIYGIPDGMIDVIWRLYKNVTLKLLAADAQKTQSHTP
jgi:hypothetical protein